MNTNSFYNEEELLIGISQSDETALRRIFDRWHQVLAGYVFRITESREMTEEIVQDVFLKIWMTRETLHLVKDFKHYLFAVCRNRCFDVLKQQLKEKKRQQTWEKDTRPLRSVTSEELENYATLIDEAIDSLPPRRKEVYLLSRHERLTYQEVAEKLNISKESVKTHIKLATASITQYIQEQIHLFLPLVPPFFFF